MSSCTIRSAFHSLNGTQCPSMRILWRRGLTGPAMPRPCPGMQVQAGQVFELITIKGFFLSPVIASCIHRPESGYRPGPFVLPLAQVLSDCSDPNETVYGLFVRLEWICFLSSLDFCCVIFPYTTLKRSQSWAPLPSPFL